MRPSPSDSATGAASPLRRPDEDLVVDPRGRLTPTQMVEQKLLALLRTGNPGLYAQAAGGQQDLRRAHGGPEGAHPFIRDA